MYVIKVGEYYVREIIGMDFMEITVKLSKELMRGFKKETADKLAKKLNGEVIYIANQVTQSEDN